MLNISVLLVVLLLSTTSAAAQDEPSLPVGLDSDEPELPAGLTDEEPALPPGLGEQGAEQAVETEHIRERLPFELTGFWEIRGGVRTQRDDHERDASLGETRLQLEFEKTWNATTVRLVGDMLYDAVYDHHTIDLEEGRGWLDLREANVSIRATDFMDVKIGRQILTWGTGDLIFVNDLFPKDWKSFFIGRDQEYLKAPSDAIKLSFYSDAANLDVVYVPCFDADRFIEGGRISYWNSMLARLAGRDAIVSVDRPSRWFHNDEFAYRVYKNVRGWELAAYGYHGFWKSPAGMDMMSGKATFPSLTVYGGSVRGQLGKGIVNVEAGYYQSRDDQSGDDASIRNDELRLLVGYEQEMMKDFTVGVQYYVEHMMDYGDYRRSLGGDSRAADENRQVITVRLTQLLINQNLKLSLFAYYSPSDRDAYLRPNIHYKVDDHWAVELGGNVFFGEDHHTFFGQFCRNSNIYAGLRYSF